MKQSVVDRDALWCLSAMLLIACSACATEPPEAAAEPRPKPIETRKLATREQLLACLDSEDRLTAHRLQLEADAEGNRAASVKAEAEAAAMVEQQRKLLKGKSQKDIDLFNDKVARYNKTVSAFNARAGELRQQQEAFNAESLAHNAACAGKTYDAEVFESVKKERAAATQAK